MTAREYLLDLEAKNGDLTPRMVLEAAREETSPIHGMFQWDDGVAAESWRLAQARNVIRQVHVIIQRTTDDERVRTRQFVLVSGTEEVPQSRYISVERALTDAAVRDGVLARAKQELLVFQRKYRNLLEASELLASGLAQSLAALEAA